jgi:hypothetical protein
MADAWSMMAARRLTCLLVMGEMGLPKKLARFVCPPKRHTKPHTRTRNNNSNKDKQRQHRAARSEITPIQELGIS